MEDFARDLAATQASSAFSNTTFALRYGGMFAMLNQVVQHVLSEQLVHGLRACFATKADWAYAPEPAFTNAHGCEGARCYIDRELVCEHRPPRDSTTRHAGPVTITRTEHALGRRYPGLSLAQARAVVTRWLWRLPDHVERAVSERALRVHALPPAVVSSGDWVAVHVRWGDKIVSESVKRPIERYLGLARAVVRRTNATRCVVFTTDADAAAVPRRRAATPAPRATRRD